MDRPTTGQIERMLELPELPSLGAPDSLVPAVLPAPTQSFEEIYDEYVDFVWRSARRLGVDEGAVDDVVQQVFMVIYRRLADFAGHPSVKAWIFAIVVRVVRDYRRTMRRKSPHVFQPATDPETLIDLREPEPHEALAKVEAA